MVLGSFTSIRADPWTKIPDPALTTLSGSVHWPRSDDSRSPAPDLLLPNPHSARGTPTDLRSRVPSLEPFRRRPTALAATVVSGPASETLHKSRPEQLQQSTSALRPEADVSRYNSLSPRWAAGSNGRRNTSIFWQRWSVGYGASCAHLFHGQSEVGDLGSLAARGVDEFDRSAI